MSTAAMPLFELELPVVTAQRTVRRQRSHTLKILNILRTEGCIRLDRLRKISANHTARITNVREILNPLGEDVKIIDKDPRTGETVYGIRRL